MHSNSEVKPALLIVAAVALASWGVIGLYQNAQLGISGGLYQPDYTVPGTRPGVNLQPGDRVISVEGIPVEKLGMESRWPRAMVPRAGESRRFLVARNGEHILVDVVYGAPSAATMNTRFGAALVGLAFLLPALWASLARSDAAVKFAQVGLAVAAASFLGVGPNLGSWNGIQDHLSTGSIVLAGALLVEFFLIFPHPKQAGTSRFVRWAIYLPWAVLLAGFVAELIVHPALYYRIGWLPDLLMLTYALAVVAAITHTLLRTSRAELTASGMYLVVAGFIIGVLAVVGAIRFGLPAWIYAGAILPVPLSIAIAVRRWTAAGSSTPLAKGAETC